MDLDDEDVKKAVADYSVGEDLSALSIEELHERITAYESEITRLRQMIDEKQQVKSDADAFFRN
jgi:uncharacterized small protein (DUF1192 family)